MKFNDEAFAVRITKKVMRTPRKRLATTKQR